MERLTQEALKDSYVLNPQQNIPNVIVVGMIYNKLGKLEDVEEELGCSIEIVIRALKNGIYVDNLNGIPEHLIVDLNNYLSFNAWNTKTYRKEGYIDLKDYGKTWWLKKDRSE